MHSQMKVVQPLFIEKVYLSIGYQYIFNRGGAMLFTFRGYLLLLHLIELTAVTKMAMLGGSLLRYFVEPLHRLEIYGIPK